MQEYIDIRGARENNLKDVTLSIPKRRITIFTGVSGSGKSSVVFDTIATEAQRQLYENFSLFIRSFLPRYPQPDADAIENLSMAVIVDQKRLGGGSHSTVGTITDIYTVLRLLFSRLGKPHAGYANAFSFNDPAGMCPECNGLGHKVMNATYLGVLEKFERAYVRRDIKTLSQRVQKTVAPYLRPRPCPLCHGARLNQAALASKINGYSIADFAAMEIDELIPILRLLEEGPVAAPLVATLIERLRHMADIGLEYLNLDRETDTLSGGEAQRVKLVKH